MSEAHLRADKWLWYARLARSRTVAAALCASGRLRINGTPVLKASVRLRPGDVLVFPHGAALRIVRVLALGTRRGPAREACLLYEPLAADPAARPPASAAMQHGDGCPAITPDVIAREMR